MKKTTFELATEMVAELNETRPTVGGWQFEVCYPPINDELRMLQDLHSKGIITTAYFLRKKQEIIENI